jgi:hypothetical protein
MAHDPLHVFRNRLRILNSIDSFELPGMPDEKVRAFLRDPVRFLIRADEPTAQLIWAALERRERPAPAKEAIDAAA